MSARRPYVEILAAGPLVDVTVFSGGSRGVFSGGGCPTASVTPAEARDHARELIEAAEQAEGWRAGEEEDRAAEPGLAIRLGPDGPHFEVTRPAPAPPSSGGK